MFIFQLRYIFSHTVIVRFVCTKPKRLFYSFTCSICLNRLEFRCHYLFKPYFHLVETVVNKTCSTKSVFTDYKGIYGDRFDQMKTRICSRRWLSFSLIIGQLVLFQRLLSRLTTPILGERSYIVVFIKPIACEQALHRGGPSCLLAGYQAELSCVEILNMHKLKLLCSSRDQLEYFHFFNVTRLLPCQYQDVFALLVPSCCDKSATGS